MNQEARIQLGHIQDFNSDRQPETFRLQRAHWEADHQASGLGIRIGRQSRNKAGILGRFDGLNAHYNWSDDVRVNLTAGYLVDSTFDGYSSERPFYGASLDLSLLDEKLQVSPFVIEQRRDGILDRRAVGAQSRWIHNQTFLSGLVDYDIYHKALNALQVSGTFTMNDRWRLSGAFDLRRSPYLTTSNALIGQRVDELSELEQTLIDIELGDIADDRTATTRYARFGIDGKLNDTWHFSADVSLSDFSSTDTSAGVLGFPAREDIYLSSQLRANNLFGEGSYGAVQLRHQDSDTSSSDSVYFNARFTMAEQWHMYARLLTSRRELKTTNRDQLQFRPSLRVDYNGFRRFRLEAEVGYDWQERETALDDLTTQGLFFRLGYRALFR